MTVHSARLAAGNKAGLGATTVYTVPAGKRTIVKGVCAWNLYAGINELYLEPYSAGGSVIGFVCVTMAANGADGEAKYPAIWLVLNAGETLRVEAQHSSVEFVISGAELDV